MNYIIEHMEKKLYPWCLLEYEHISQIVGKENLIFTNLTKSQAEKLKRFGTCYTESISKLTLHELHEKFEQICVLDPEAVEQLKPSDAKKFKHLLFGGILGDNPPRKRTQEELILEGIERRNIGKEQFPTDNAVYVCKKIIEGVPLENLRFQDEVEIEIAEEESVILPFRYVLVDGKPLICDALMKHLKTNKGF